MGDHDIMKVDNELALLEQFVVDNEDLLRLESRIGKFNIFDALGLARVEIRHSNFFAFILDPAESHGQGQLFLKALLMDILKKAPADRRPFSPIELDGSDLRGVEITREWRNIDLLITCQEPTFVVVIENKVDSGEHDDQLLRYETTISEYFRDATPVYVYLTPTGASPSRPKWMRYSYEDIRHVFTRVRSTYGKAIGNDVLVFLDHYLTLIESLFMNDNEIDELCRRIHKNHRRAMQLIWERVGNPSRGIFAEVENVLRDDARWHFFKSAATRIDFAPAAWLDWLPRWETCVMQSRRSSTTSM